MTEAAEELDFERAARLRDDLTLSAGVRYELQKYPLLDDQAPYPLAREVGNDTDNFAPRLGVTWRPGGSQRASQVTDSPKDTQNAGETK